MNKIIYTFVAFAGILLIANCSPKTVKNSTTSNTKTNDNNRQDKSSETKELSEDEKASVAIEGDKLTVPFMDFPSQVALFNSTPKARVEMGAQLYKSECSKCHKAYEPSSRNLESWTKVMKSMAPKAKLNDPKYIMIGAYLKANTK